MRASFSYSQITAQVRARPPSRRTHSNGAYIGMPKAWKGKKVKLTLANSKEPPIEKVVVGTTSFLVSAPVEWIGKTVIVQLVEQGKKSKD